MSAVRSATSLIFLTAAIAVLRAAPIPVKVVVVTMFERGADAGDQPGELQFWVERNQLNRVIPFPQGFHDLRMNSNGVLAVLTGVGTAKAAAAIMALGMDPRFDLTRAYWIVAGIAGINPERGSIGSAAWAEWVVDGDLAREIDSREIPANWKTGYLPLRGSMPYEQPRDSSEGEVYHLEPGLVDWAFRLTEDVLLADSQGMRAERSRYAAANAQRPPFVTKGDTLSAGTFWPAAERLGHRLGSLPDWRQGRVRHHGHGRHRNTSVTDSTREGRPRRHQSRSGLAHGQQFRSTPGRRDTGGKSGAVEAWPISGISACARSCVEGGEYGG